MGSDLAREIAHEQGAVDERYARLDDLRGQAARRLDEVRRSRAGGNIQNQGERDSLATSYEQRLSRLSAVESRLLFGRLDLEGGECRYVGRIGLSDDDQRQLLVDWRAPAAEPFYQATARAPGDVVRRRHIALSGRSVTGLEDELLVLDRADGSRGDGLVLNGEGALMAALGEHRTGQMRDIVSTIQGEQDRIIRSSLPGVLVVQGGPGTGKTAVALHRAAYLLYTYRSRARSGVLVVGPNAVFLRYIEQVLPSLGESGVVMATMGTLFPGVEATGDEADGHAARLKGSLGMVRLLRRAVADRQRVPAAPLTLMVDGTRVVLRPEEVERARARARRSPRPHNQARRTFVRELLLTLAASLASARHRSFDPTDCDDLLADLRDAPDVRREVNLCWMPLTPQRLLADLWADQDRLARAAPRMSSDDRRALWRPRDAAWTIADVPLLDEAAELLGEDDEGARQDARRRAAERAEEVGYARAVLDQVGGLAGARLKAEGLADRYAAPEAGRTVAESARGDRTWVYAHLVVDEAQELSDMAWRLLVRRCPSRSMTVVGDSAQTASPAGAGSWAQVFDRHAPGRWRVAELTVSYRTPEPVMRAAGAVLAAAGVDVPLPRAARSGPPPTAVHVPEVDAEAVAEVVSGELGSLGEGRLAVVVPRLGFPWLADGLRRRLPDGVVADGVDLGAPVVVLDVGQVKGLEFDVVVVVEPADVVGQSPRGVNDLYVALTRPTRRLVVVHGKPLPAGLDQIAARG